jgi:hypothetical protein
MYGKAFIKSGIAFILGAFIMMLFNTVNAQIDNYNYDVMLSKMVVDNIKENYTAFNSKALIYKESLEDTYKSFDFYLDEYDSKNAIIVEKINKIQEDLNNLEENSLNMYKYCLYKLNNEEINGMCNTFKENYKGVVSSYKTMLDDYNGILDQYNDYASKKSLEKVDKFEKNLPNTLDKIYEKIK